MTYTRKPFDHTCKEVMNESTFPRITGIPYEESFSLTGAFGVRTYKNLTNVSMHHYYPSPQLLITERDFYLETQIRFFSNSVHAETILAQGVGKQIMISQIENAIKWGFKFIDCEAARGTHNDGKTQYIGYKLWHRFGFQMDAISQKRFDEFILRLKNNKVIKEEEEIKTLNDFTLNPYYKTIWDEKGESWGGIFDLSEGSVSRRIFEDYKSKVGL